MTDHGHFICCLKPACVLALVVLVTVNSQMVAAESASTGPAPVASAPASMTTADAEQTASKANALTAAKCQQSFWADALLPLPPNPDIAAEQLRRTIERTSEPELRSKLKAAYLRHLGCPMQEAP